MLFIVTELLPKETTSNPISITSPCLAELTKLISDTYFVTIFFSPTWHIAKIAASSSIQANNLPPNNV